MDGHYFEAGAYSNYYYSKEHSVEAWLGRSSHVDLNSVKISDSRSIDLIKVKT